MGKCRCLGESSLAVFNFLDLVFGCVLLTASLVAHEKVDWVRFPGLESDPEYEKNKKYLKGKGGSMVVFGVVGGAEAGSKFIDSLKLVGESRRPSPRMQCYY